MIQTAKFDMDRTKARELWRDYKKHQHYSQPIDREIQRVYHLIAQGRVVIRALECICLAGANEQGLPKLAIIRADARECHLYIRGNGEARFSMTQSPRGNETRSYIDLPPGSFQPVRNWNHRAIVPLVPIHLRPKRGLQNYHILFEAEWQRVVPKDPLLLRRIGKGDMWLVVAAWDLTEVERAALSARLQ